MKARIVSSVLIMLIGLTVAVYAGPLFSQHFSIVPASVQVLTANCTTLWPSPPGVAPGSNGALYFGCAASGCLSNCFVANVAFTVAADGAAIPTFAPLPAPYTGVALVPPPAPNPPTAGCTMPATGTVLTSGTAFSFTGTTLGKGSLFYYCVSYTNALSTGLPAFDVAWTQ